MSANALAVNVYFENKRRKATGFSWTITGLGPIILPHITIFLLDVYGSQGTILVYAGMSLNTFMCSLTLQPVQRHVPKAKVGPVTEVNRPHEILECEYCQNQKKRKRSIFSGDYLYKDGEDLTTPGYEIMETGTPIKAGANDGWFGSKISLTNANASRQRASKLLRQISQQDSVEKGVGFQEDGPQSCLYQPNNFHRERKVSTKSMADEVHCTCAEGQRLLQNLRLEELAKDHHLVEEEEQEEELRKNGLTLLQKVVVFFDLDLLKDVTFINLVVGMTIMIFGEVNFSVLTPFILNSFGYTDTQISIAMSLLAGIDIAVRFLAPFALERLKLTNSMSFAIGILAITIGRMAVTVTDSYYVVLAIFMLIGFGKGLRMVLAQLLIPSYVPLKRLAAASGLQLIFNSIVSFTLGPLLGKGFLERMFLKKNFHYLILLGTITDQYGFNATIHFLNIITCVTLVLWLLEFMLRKGQKPVTPT